MRFRSKRWFVHALAGFSLVLVCGSPALAVGRTEKIVLTVSGKISKPNAVMVRTYTLSQLEKLPQTTFTTKTPWYPQPVTMSGPLLRDILKDSGASGTKVMAIALDDYKAEIPLEDATKYDVIVAHRMNGKPMSVRERGPLFVIYPFDTAPELQAERYYFRSAWQLYRLVVE